MHNVELVHVTPDAESLIAYMARVSNPDNQDNPDCIKLIKYLIKHNHWSPFEMVNMCVQIDTTRSVASQILRHRSFSFQEFSQRYAQVVNTPSLPNFRRQDTTNRQNSIDEIDEELKIELNKDIENLFNDINKVYYKLLENGVAKECARMVLPMCSPTRLYMSGSVRSWIHYLNVRCDESTQLEHRKIGLEIKEIFKQELPIIYDAVFN